MMIHRHWWMVTLLMMVGFMTALPAATESGQDAAQEVPVEFTNGAATLRGSLMIPDGDGPFPALVFVHGSGDGPRSDFRIFAEQFARAGIASLIYDKRGSGESTGSWGRASLRLNKRVVVDRTNYRAPLVSAPAPRANAGGLTNPPA